MPGMPGCWWGCTTGMIRCAMSKARWTSSRIVWWGLSTISSAVDVEQYWADWAEWRQQYITKKLGATTISVSSHQLASEIKKLTGKKTMIYTRASFVKEYAPTMQVWLKDWDLWLAHYPYRPGRVSVSWEGLKAANLPSIPGPSIPPNCREWKFWQFSGDKFVLPG